MPHSLEKQNQKQIFTNSIKILKMDHIKKECKTLTAPHLKNMLFQDLPGGQVLRTPCLLGRRHEFHPESGN